MKGSPVFRTLAAVVGLVSIGIVLFRITQANDRTSTVSAERAVTATAVPALIRIRTSHPPQSLTLRQESRIIAEFKNSQDQEWEIESSLTDPADGVELLLEANWEDGPDHVAVTVELEPDALEAKSHTEWSDSDELSVFLDFRWP
ncbi:MAG: hypothetical protein O3C21_11295 [Verrucomicrobia bacterium]|nr:hypothetical protein [Verrucomicrobiota bacterium]